MFERVENYMRSVRQQGQANRWLYYASWVPLWIGVALALLAMLWLYWGISWLITDTPPADLDLKRYPDATAGDDITLGVISVGVAIALAWWSYHLLVRKRQGDLHNARTQLKQRLAIQESLGNSDSPAAATNRADLGVVLYDLGDLRGARAQLERALAIHEATLGPDVPEVAANRNNLGMVLYDLGDLRGARAQLEQALAIAEATLGPDHPDVATCYSNLGMVLQALGDQSAAAVRQPLLLRLPALWRRWRLPWRRTAGATEQVRSDPSARGDRPLTESVFFRHETEQDRRQRKLAYRMLWLGAVLGALAGLLFQAMAAPLLRS